MKKLKIALVMPTHSNLNSSLHNLLKVYLYLIREYGVEVTMFTDKRNEFAFKGFKVEKINGIDHGTILEKILLFLGMQRDYYTDLIGKLEGYDVIETSNPEFYRFAYQSYIAAKKHNIKLIYRTSQTIDGFYLFRLTKFIPLKIAEKAYRHAKWLLFSNPQAAERCIRLGLAEKDSEKIVITGHATDTKLFSPKKTGRMDGKTVLLSVGGIYKIKGHHLIIRALKEVVDNGHDAELWIVGDGYYKKSLVRLAKKLGISDKVKFLGSKDHKELADIYNKADIFVLANYQEITPAVNEALACEKPVVVMECGGVDYVIPGTSYGMVSKKFDVDDMAQKIIYLINNKKISYEIGRNGRQRILQNFSIEKVGEKFYKCFIS